MSEIKSHEFDSLVAKRPLGHSLFLIFGPDRGLVSERARQAAHASGVALDDPFSVIRLEAGELSSTPGRMVEEMQSIGLFGGNRLVWIKNASGEKGVSDGLQILAAAPPEGSFLIIEAGDLKKTHALRKVAENARFVVSVPCYSDDIKSLNSLIDTELGREGLRITPEARELLISALGGDRIASRNEVRKLALYCLKQGVVDANHVEEIIGDASAISTDDAVDAILSGDSSAFLRAVEKIVHSKTPLFLVLQGCLRQFQLLDQMRMEMDEKRIPAAQVMQSLGRGVHFKRKPVMERALRTWSAQAIAREMNRIQAAILQSRQKQALEESIVLHTLLSTTLQSAKRG